MNSAKVTAATPKTQAVVFAFETAMTLLATQYAHLQSINERQAAGFLQLTHQALQNYLAEYVKKAESEVLQPPMEQIKRVRQRS